MNIRQAGLEEKCFSIMVEHVKDYAIFLTDPAGIIVSWNHAAAAMKGYSAPEAIGSPLHILYTEQQVADRLPEHNLRLAAENGTYQEETWRRKKDGTVFWAMIELIALRHDDGELFGFCKITRDISERRALQQGLAIERARANATLSAIEEGVISVRPDGMVDFINPKAEQLTGRLSSEAKGMALPALLRQVAADDQDAGDADLLADTTMPGVENIEAKNGRRHVIARSDSIITGEAGEAEGYVVVLHDVAPQLHAEMAVRQAEKRKDEFLAMLAHELRNPLAPISAAAELLSSGKLDEPGVKRTSQVISRQVAHMTSLVDDLLDVSRITKGLVSLEKSPVNMKTLVAGALEQARPMIEARMHALQVSLPAEAANVYGDPVRLVQVCVNLLNNAAKYTPLGGKIALRVTTSDDEIICEVEDNGIGIDSEMQAHVFELFEQAQRSSDRAQGGLGIGLALVKRICELHGGSVSCTSQLGKGSIFTFRLPRLQAVEGVPERRVMTRGIAPAKQAMRVLVVDDNADGAEMLGALLEMEGHDVTTANDPHFGLALARERDFDFCILDIGLPGMNGYELCRKILEGSSGSAKPTMIALTGFGQERDKGAAYDAGFTHYLVKPVDIGLLNAALENPTPVSGSRQETGQRFLH
jgi:PAS domain S-box-containing protein